MSLLQNINILYIRKICFSASDWIYCFLVDQSSPTLWDSMNYSTPGFPVLHQLSELTHTYIHWVSDAIQPSHPLSSPSPPAFSLSQHQGLFKWVTSSHQIAKVLELQFQHQSFQCIYSGLISFRIDWVDLLDREEDRLNLRTLCCFSIVFPRASLSSSWLILNTAAYVPSVSA